MTPDRLFSLACEFAESRTLAERARAEAARTTGDESDRHTREAAAHDSHAVDRRERLQRALFTGAYTLGPDGARHGADPAYAQVLANLHLRIYPRAGGTDEVTDRVVLDMHGVSVQVQRRRADLYVHLDTTETPDRVIALEINGGGEHDHPTR